MADWKQKLADAVSGSGGTAVEDQPEPVIHASPATAAKQRTWSLRYKLGNHPAEAGTIMASSRELAEAVGRKWCERKSNGLMHGVRFIAVDDPILADESILG